MQDVNHTDTLIELNSKLERLLSGIELLSQKQNSMAEDISKIEEDISKIREAVYNPDEGFYARLRALEQWRTSTAKIQWLVLSTVVALAIKQVWDTITVQ